jgi:glutamate racemase
MRKMIASISEDTAPLEARFESMLLRAGSLTRSRTLGVLAPPSALTSHSYDRLKRRVAAGLTIIEADCYGWAEMIDKDLSRHIDLQGAVGEMTRWQADVILIVGSPYSSLKDRIASVVGPSVRVLDSLDYI